MKETQNASQNISTKRSAQKAKDLQIGSKRFLARMIVVMMLLSPFGMQPLLNVEAISLTESDAFALHMDAADPIASVSESSGDLSVSGAFLSGVNVASTTDAADAQTNSGIAQPVSTQSQTFRIGEDALGATITFPTLLGTTVIQQPYYVGGYGTELTTISKTVLAVGCPQYGLPLATLSDPTGMVKSAAASRGAVTGTAQWGFRAGVKQSSDYPEDETRMLEETGAYVWASGAQMDLGGFGSSINGSIQAFTRTQFFGTEAGTIPNAAALYVASPLDHAFHINNRYADTAYLTMLAIDFNDPSWDKPFGWAIRDRSGTDMGMQVLVIPEEEIASYDITPIDASRTYGSKVAAPNSVLRGGVTAGTSSSPFSTVASSGTTSVPASSTSTWRPYGTAEKELYHTTMDLSLNMGMVIRKDGSLQTWGTTPARFAGTGTSDLVSSGILGTGRETATPVTVLSRAQHCTVNGDGPYYVSAFAIQDDGTLYGWGNNDMGQLGIETKPRIEGILDRNEAIPVKIMDNVDYVTGDGLTTLVLKQDGTLWAAGGRTFTELSTRTRAGYFDPSWRKLLDGVRYMRYINKSLLFLTEDQTLWGVGFNGEAALGNGEIGDFYDHSDPAHKSTPIRILSNVQKMDTGRLLTTGVRTDGSAWAWGEVGYFSMAGFDRGRMALRPERQMENVRSYIIGNTLRLAVQKDGSVWGCGEDFFNELGLGDTPQVDYVQKPGRILDNVVDAASGVMDDGICCWFLRADGTLWGSGANHANQLLNTVGKQYNRPVKVLDNVMLPGKATSLALSASSGGTAASGTTGATDATTAGRSASTILLNGVPVPFEAYVIGGNNWFRLRDVAFALQETERRFGVSWDGEKKVVAMATGEAYVPIGGEMAINGDGVTATATAARSTVTVDGALVNLEAWVIGGSNYFRLRDLGTALGFGVDWDPATRSVLIDTTSKLTD